MKLLDNLFTFLEMNNLDEEINKSIQMFIKVFIIMIFLIAILGISLFAYLFITQSISNNISFGLIDNI